MKRQCPQKTHFVRYMLQHLEQKNHVKTFRAGALEYAAVNVSQKRERSTA